MRKALPCGVRLYWWVPGDGPGDEVDGDQFLEAVGEHAVADAGDSLADLGEVGRALGQGRDDQAVPVCAQQGEGPAKGRDGLGRLWEFAPVRRLRALWGGHGGCPLAPYVVVAVSGVGCRVSGVGPTGRAMALVVSAHVDGAAPSEKSAHVDRRRTLGVLLRFRVDGQDRDYQPGQEHGARGDERHGVAVGQRLARLRHQAEVVGGEAPVKAGRCPARTARPIGMLT